MAGRDFRITAAQARQAHAEHMAGWSCRALARLRWREWGYASADAADRGLRGAFRALGLPVRDPRAASLDANLRHGGTYRAMRAIDHPDHRVYLEHEARLHRQARARRQGEAA